MLHILIDTYEIVMTKNISIISRKKTVSGQLVVTPHQETLMRKAYMQE